MTRITTEMGLAADGKAVTRRKLFSRETAVGILIQADPAIVWRLLTNAADFPRWNSTVVAVTGEIRAGETIRLQAALDEKRVFKLKIKEMEPEKRLVWGDRQGNRVYSLHPGAGDMVTFTMTEKIGGPFFPLYAGQIPPFDAAFAQFAADLKKEAEAIHNSKNE